MVVRVKPRTCPCFFFFFPRLFPHKNPLARPSTGSGMAWMPWFYPSVCRSECSMKTFGSRLGHDKKCLQIYTFLAFLHIFAASNPTDLDIFGHFGRCIGMYWIYGMRSAQREWWNRPGPVGSLYVAGRSRRQRCVFDPWGVLKVGKKGIKKPSKHMKTIEIPWHIMRYLPTGVRKLQSVAFVLSFGSRIQSVPVQLASATSHGRRAEKWPIWGWVPRADQ